VAQADSAHPPPHPALVLLPTSPQSLKIRQRCIFDADVLEAMVQLRHIMFHNVIITAQPGRPRTRHLANMPQLQHLELPMYDDDGLQQVVIMSDEMATAEAPFLTASSQLTHLSLGHNFGSMGPACYTYMFTPRSVPALCGAPAQSYTLGPLAPHLFGEGGGISYMWTFFCGGLQWQQLVLVETTPWLSIPDSTHHHGSSQVVP